ncbi:hypothetical protein LGH70_22845 [Hymenobacter sp. BT635]|uniref:Phage abortive infection protein n=1 Tax=Hymenobacter nitidus TaxID=2880929 RepID=A0ABS8ALR2_9BACT|nr:hypothetical protein [Hymenobacter nitidus]MCB2380449.1 hypothetical protein [Hymenobacter nitidus]
MEAQPKKLEFWSKIKPNTNTKWAVWTICIGAFLSIILPALISQFYWEWPGVNFHDTGQVGDTIGGVAGPILNFVGLLVVYFSLREQAKSMAEQKTHFDMDQVRSDNENVLGTALKLLDDLKAEVEKLSDDKALSQSASTAHVNITNSLAIGFRTNLANGSLDERFLFRRAGIYEYDAVSIKGREGALKKIVSDFFKLNEVRFTRLSLLLEIFTYLIVNSKLPSSVKAMLYSMSYTLVERLIENSLGVALLFRKENKAINALIAKLIILDELLIEDKK